MAAESWILPADAIEMGFATEIEEFEDASAPSQCARRALVGMVSDAVAHQQAQEPDDPDDDPDGDDEDPDETDDDPDGQGDDPDDGESDDDPDGGKQQAATKQPNGLLSFLQTISK